MVMGEREEGVSFKQFNQNIVESAFFLVVNWISLFFSEDLKLHHAKRSWRIRRYVHPQVSVAIKLNLYLTIVCSVRKCSASNRILSAKDHASIQINLAEVDESTGRMTGAFKTYAICGAIRRMGESDDCINRLAKKDGILDKKF